MKLALFEKLQNFIEENNLSGIIIAVISFVIIVFFSFSDAYNLFEFKLYDLRFQVKPSVDEWDSLAFLNIDEGSINNLGEFPWPRNLYGKGLEVLKSVGIRQMTFDIQFPDPSPTMVNKRMLEKLDSRANRGGRISSEDLKEVVLDNDKFLAETIANINRVILPYNFQKEAVKKYVDAAYQREMDEAHSIFLEKASIRIPKEKVSEYSGFVDPERVDVSVPIPELVRAAHSFGFVDRDPDIDGIERRIRLVRLLDDRLYFEMGLVMLMDICDVKKEALIIEPGRRIVLKDAFNPITYETEDIEIPIDDKGMIYINWAGPGPLEDSFHHISFYALLEYPLVSRDVHNFFDEQEMASGSNERSQLYGELGRIAGEYNATSDAQVKKRLRQKSREIKERIGEIEKGYKKVIQQGIDEVKAELQKGDNPELQQTLDNLKNYLTAINIVLRVESLQDRVGIVGLTATGTQDLGAIPIHNEYMMVGTYPNIVNTIVHQSFITRMGSGVNIVLWFIAAMLMGYIIQRLDARRSMILIVSALLFVNLVAIGLFALFNVWLDQLGITLAVFLPSAVIASIKFMKEESQKRYIKGAFSRYLSPGVIEQIIKDPDALELGGENREITIFFSDVAKFSTISEKLNPPQLVSLLNEYLSAMTDIILSYNGTIDKYEGDAIMAFYGAPYSFDDHAIKCCFAAIDMKRRLREMQEVWRKAGKDELFVRMGMNTGDAVVGNMGSSTRMDYTAMGDSVNLASRLEGVNKQYQTYALISETTYNATKEHIEARKLDTVRVVGKEEPIVIYELLSRKGGLPDKMLDMLDKYYNALDHFQKRDWKKSLALFKAALKIIPDDGPCLTYRERCEKYIKQPPAKSWDGVYSLKVK